jgi:hypothetical protein
MRRLLFPILAFLAASSLSVLAASPADQLDHLQKVFASTPQFGEQFWRESKRVADQSGPQIIHAVMQRSKKWREEEGLVFVPLVALLPRKPALELLHRYERSSESAYRTWAHEFLIELDSPDVRESVRKFSGRS